MGGSCQHVPPKDDNPYACWAYGLDVMETRASLVLDGIWHQGKAVGLMEKAHVDHDEKRREENIEED